MVKIKVTQYNVTKSKSYIRSSKTNIINKGMYGKECEEDKNNVIYKTQYKTKKSYSIVHTAKSRQGCVWEKLVWRAGKTSVHKQYGKCTVSIRQQKANETSCDSCAREKRIISRKYSRKYNCVKEYIVTNKCGKVCRRQCSLYGKIIRQRIKDKVIKNKKVEEKCALMKIAFRRRKYIRGSAKRSVRSVIVINGKICLPVVDKMDPSVLEELDRAMDTDFPKTTEAHGKKCPRASACTLAEQFVVNPMSPTFSLSYIPAGQLTLSNLPEQSLVKYLLPINHLSLLNMLASPAFLYLIGKKYCVVIYIYSTVIRLMDLLPINHLSLLNMLASPAVLYFLGKKYCVVIYICSTVICLIDAGNLIVKSLECFVDSSLMKILICIDPCSYQYEQISRRPYLNTSGVKCTKDTKRHNDVIYLYLDNVNSSLVNPLPHRCICLWSQRYNVIGTIGRLQPLPSKITSLKTNVNSSTACIRKSEIKRNNIRHKLNGNKERLSKPLPSVLVRTRKRIKFTSNKGNIRYRE
jgi:hypothetical protein